MTADQPTKTPVHLWIIGVVTLLWNAMGANDFVQTQLENAEYMEQMGVTERQMEFFYAVPTWLVVAWGVAVFGGVLGSLLLLLRKQLAIPVLMVSFVAMAVTAIRNFGFADGLDVMGTAGAVFSGLIFVVALGLVFYARLMKARGVLG